MSTAIYDAYKIRDPRKVWDVLWKIRDLGQANIKKVLRAHYWELVRTMPPDNPIYKECVARNTIYKEYVARNKFSPGQQEKHELTIRLRTAQKIVLQGFREDVTSGVQNTYSLEVSVSLYPHKSGFYIRVFCQRASLMRDVLDFVPKMDELEDFYYQNSTDRPEDVTEKQWKLREEIWKEILITKSDKRGRHVSLNLLDWGSYLKFDPCLDFYSEWRGSPPNWKGNPPKLPTQEEVEAEKLVKYFKRVTARPGIIRADKVVIRKIGPKRWSSTIKGKVKKHPGLAAAVGHVQFEHLPKDQQDLIETVLRNGRERMRVRTKK